MSAADNLGKQFLYHESTMDVRDSIRSEGLRPGKEWSFTTGEVVPSGVYLSPHGRSEYSSSVHDASWFGYDRWRVDVSGLDVKTDPTQPNSAHYVPDHIPPDRVRLVKKGHPDWQKHL